MFRYCTRLERKKNKKVIIDVLNSWCIAPPKAVKNLKAVAEDSSIVLTWTRPESGERLDVYYTIAISNPNNLGIWIAISDHFKSSNDNVSFNITGVLPDTSYDVRVVAHNGISDQDSASESSRTVSIIVRTRQGGMFGSFFTKLSHSGLRVCS